MQDETTTPTEENLEEVTGVDESTLPEAPEDKSAVEEDVESVEVDTEDDSDAESTEIDPKLLNYAKAQGFDSDNLSEDTLKALKIARDNQRDFRSSGKEFGKDVESLYENDGDIRNEIHAIKAKQQVQDFFMENPDARKYEQAMGKVLKDEKAKYGADAARILSANLPRLLREAKLVGGEDDTAAAVEQAKRQERQRFNKQQQVSRERADATNTGSKGGTKVTREWLANEYDPSNPEHRALVDKSLS